MEEMYERLKEERDYWFNLAVKRGATVSVLVHTIKFHQRFGGELETIYKFTDETISDSERLELKFNTDFGGFKWKQE